MFTQLDLIRKKNPHFLLIAMETLSFAQRTPWGPSNNDYNQSPMTAGTDHISCPVLPILRGDLRWHTCCTPLLLRLSLWWEPPGRLPFVSHRRPLVPLWFLWTSYVALDFRIIPFHSIGERPKEMFLFSAALVIRMQKPHVLITTSTKSATTYEHIG